MPTSKTRTKPATTAVVKPVPRRTPKPKPTQPVKAFDFITANRPLGRTELDIPFTLGDVDADGEPIYYYVRGEAKAGALGVISGEFIRAEENSDNTAQVVGMLDMMDNLFTEDTARALLRKLKNPADRFGDDELGEVLRWAIHQVTDRPTTP